MRSVAEHFYTALEGGNGTAACSLLTSGARAAVVRPLQAIRDSGLRRRIDCATLMTLYGRSIAADPAALREMKRTRFGAVVIRGSEATVVVRVPHEGARQAPLVNTPVGWRISEIIVRALPSRKPIGG